MQRQRELDREIANKTGETVHTLRGLGFSPLMENFPMEERTKPLIVDWDLEQRFRKIQRKI